jgi:hypothetical protein
MLRGSHRRADTADAPGHIALPNGLGLIVHDADEARAVGVAPNELTAAEDRDQWAGTPWRKHVPAKIEVM